MKKHTRAYMRHRLAVKKGGTVNNKTKKRPHKWSLKYKRSIDCSHPRGFSQRQHCKYGRKNTIKRH